MNGKSGIEHQKIEAAGGAEGPAVDVMGLESVMKEEERGRMCMCICICVRCMMGLDQGRVERASGDSHNSLPGSIFDLDRKRRFHCSSHGGYDT